MTEQANAERWRRQLLGDKVILVSIVLVIMIFIVIDTHTNDATNN